MQVDGVHGCMRPQWRPRPKKKLTFLICISNQMCIFEQKKKTKCVYIYVADITIFVHNSPKTWKCFERKRITEIHGNGKCSSETEYPSSHSLQDGKIQSLPQGCSGTIDETEVIRKRSSASRCLVLLPENKPRRVSHHWSYRSFRHSSRVTNYSAHFKFEYFMERLKVTVTVFNIW